MTRNPSPPPAVMDGEGLSLIYKRIKPKNGIMAMLPGENNSQFFPEGTEIPSDLMDSAEQISGRMECTENGPQFVAGKVMVCSFLGLATFQKLLQAFASFCMQAFACKLLHASFCILQKCKLLMSCPSTGPKMFCAGPNVLGQTKN